MAVQIQAHDPAANSDPISVLRKRLDAMIHERDALKERYDRALDKVADLDAQHRYQLAIRCDFKGCKAVVSVSTSSTPPNGVIAQNLIALAAAMRFTLGLETARAMRALLGDRASPSVNVGSADLCSGHVGL